MVGAFVPVRLADAGAHEEGRERAVKVARLVAAVSSSPRVVLADDNGTDPVRTRMAGRITREQALGAEAWRVVAHGAETIARAVREATGADTVFHHHCAGFVETPAEVATLLEATSAELVGLCLDTGHWTFAGGDAVEALRRYGKRVRHVHFKDCDPHVAARAREDGVDYFEAVRRGVFCELGRGSVDFGAALGALREAEYAGWIVVEQDVFPGMGTPLESATRSREHLRSLGSS
jgi:inosose dehydratase